MSLSIRRGIYSYHFVPYGFAPPRLDENTVQENFKFSSRADAATFLRGLAGDSGSMTLLRRIAHDAGLIKTVGFGHPEIVDLVAWELVRKRLTVIAQYYVPITTDQSPGEARPAVRSASPGGPGSKMSEEDPDTFGDSDADAQAAALRAAAENGTPFCEECERARQQGSASSAPSLPQNVPPEDGPAADAGTGAAPAKDGATAGSGAAPAKGEDAKPGEDAKKDAAPDGGSAPGDKKPDAKKKKFVEIHWVEADAWCGDTVKADGTTENYSDGDKVAIKVVATSGGSQVANFDESIAGDKFSHAWKVQEVLPPKSGANYVKVMEVDAQAEGKTSPTHLKINFIPTVPKTHYAQARAHFDLSATDYQIKIESELEYVKGWGGSVVKLGPAAPAGTGGLLDGSLAWPGYRWMKSVAGTPKFWDGTAWKDLPAGFALADANNFAVGFYKTGTTFTCQYGGTWPETFTDWDLNAAANQAKLTAWVDNIHSVWTGKFDIKRHECTSAAPLCCRYSTDASAKFTLKAAFAAGMLIIAEGNIRSNDSLWFIGGRVTMAGHEFGHHLANPDEYAGAVLDTSLNTDGAVNGIDANSIMGVNMSTVKKRHYKTICAHFASMVKTLTGKTYTYEPVAVVAR